MVFVLEIEDRDPKARPFLGGWRNTVNGLLYYNACTQTCVTRRDGCEIKDNATQAVEQVDKSTNVNRDRMTQVHGFPEIGDKLLTPGDFSSGNICSVPEDLDDRILESVVKIQRFYRAYRKRTASETTEFRPQEKKSIEVAQREAPFRRSADFTILNRNSPRTRGDFELLHDLLDHWRILETERANRTLFRPSRVALCSSILSREVELLRAINSTKSKVRARAREMRNRRFLDELSRPLVWKNSQGEPIHVETQLVQRAREYKALYTSLSKEDVSTQERAELLRDLRRTVASHTCRHSDELIYLIDQELDLTARGVRSRSLRCLRKRLRLTFLRLARNALSQDNSLRDEENTRLCKSLPAGMFSDGSRRNPRGMYEPYERMLRELRRSERKLGCRTSLAFVISTEGVCCLANAIWHGKSAVSECDDVNRLRLVRLYKQHEWSPWNCLLLTKEEALTHYGLDDIHAFYDRDLLREFRVKNLQAKLRDFAWTLVRGENSPS